MMAIGARTLDAFLEVVTAAENLIARCKACRGAGRIPEHFEVFRMVDGERLQRSPSGRATEWHECEDCGELRRTIAAARCCL